MKLFQYDKKIWDNGEVSHTWQFGIIKNKSLLWVNFETPGGISHYAGGINILFSFFVHKTCLLDALWGIPYFFSLFSLPIRVT